MRKGGIGMADSTQGFVLALRSKYPCATLAEIGEIAGISKERVRQHLKKNGSHTKAEPIPPQLYACMTCGTASTYRRFCSAECRLEVSHPRVSCAWGGKEFRRAANQINRWARQGARTGLFCSKKCFVDYSRAFRWRTYATE